MIGAWIASIVRSSRSATAASVMPKAKALEQRGDNRVAANKPRLPGMRGKALQMEAIMPWPNLAVSRAVITGAYELNLSRTREGDLSVVLQPSARPINKATAKIAVGGGRRPDALVRIEYAFRRSLTGSLSGKASAGSLSRAR
jgi:hypothetical protein